MVNEEIPVFPAVSLLWPDMGYQGYLPATVIMTYQLRKKLKNKKAGPKISLSIEKFLPSGLRWKMLLEVSSLAT